MSNLLFLFVDTSDKYNPQTLVDAVKNSIELNMEYGKIFIFMLLIAALISQVIRN